MTDRRMEAHRPVTAKLSMKRYDQITALATLARTSAADQIRASLDDYFAARLKDPNLKQMIEASTKRHRDKLAVLAGEVPTATPVKAVSEPPNRAKDEKAVSLRIDDRTFNLLTGFALLDDTTLADQLRKGIDEYVEARLNDHNLHSQVEEARERNRRILAVLA